MARSQLKATQGFRGGKYKARRKKRKCELGGEPALTKLDERRASMIRTLGGHLKSKVLSTTVANVLDKNTKKCIKVKIKTISENPANRHYVRRNIMTKGAVIDTELGKARITSRPGQDGTVNAVLAK